MTNNLPDITFERGLNHNFMILTNRSFFDEPTEEDIDYRKQMLLENDIPGLLPLKLRQINGQTRYYYEINSLQSFDSFYAKREINFDELRNILGGCAKLFENLEEYLLDGSQIILRPEYIYIDVNTFEPYFVCFPDFSEDIRLSYVAFIDMLLTKIDHSDNNAVLLSYKIYRYTKNPNYVMSEIRHMIDSFVPEIASQYIPEKMAMPQTQPIAQPPQTSYYPGDNGQVEDLGGYDYNNNYNFDFDKGIGLATDDKPTVKKEKKNKKSSPLTIVLCIVVGVVVAGIILVV